jgi:hypothetical protein
MILLARFKKFIQLVLISSFVIGNTQIVASSIASAGISAAAYTIGILLALSAHEEYKTASDPKVSKKTYKEQAEHWLVRSWNKVQRAFLGRTSTPEIAHQELTEMWVQFRSWWRRYNQVSIKLFIALSMALIGLIYTKKALGYPDNSPE